VPGNRQVEKGIFENQKHNFNAKKYFQVGKTGSSTFQTVWRLSVMGVRWQVESKCSRVLPPARYAWFSSFSLNTLTNSSVTSL
jgi:hypothetical protein